MLGDGFRKLGRLWRMARARLEPDAAPSYLTDLADDRADRRLVAAWALAMLAPRLEAREDLQAALRSALSDSEPLVRRRAAAASARLARYDTPLAEALLERAADDPERPVRHACLDALMQAEPTALASASGFPAALLALTADEDRDVRWRAALALGAGGAAAEPARQPILEFLAHSDWRMRTAAIQSLGSLGLRNVHEARQALTLLHDPEPAAQPLAADAVLAAGPQAIGWLADLLADDDARIRLGASRLLEEFAATEREATLGALLAVSTSGSDEARALATFGIGRLARGPEGNLDPRCLDVLHARLGDPNPRVQEVARRALAGEGDGSY